tara:strand:+ start:3250 stop:4647 length:1398 start_codon:yes stop_codon:yes gene_type:complete
MGKDAPPAPDYAGAAQATAEGSEKVTNQQTWANRPDQVNPWGEVSWGTEKVRDPATGQNVTKWTQNQTLDPNAQAALDSQLDLTRGRSDLAGGMMSRVGDELGDQMNFDQYGDMNTGVRGQGLDMGDLPQGVNTLNANQYAAPELQKDVDYSGAQAVGDGAFQRDRAEGAIIDRTSARLDPRMQQARQAQEVKLQSQGLAAGDEAYNDAMQNFDQTENDAYSSMYNDAIKFGGDEASRTFGMDMSKRDQETGEVDRSGAFGNTARGQQAGLDMATGGQSFAEQSQAGSFRNNSREQQLAEQIRVKDRDYNLGNADADRENAIRTASMNEEVTERGQSLNEMNALISGQQVGLPTMAPVTTASKAQGPDMLGAANSQYQSELDAFNAKQSGLQGMMSGGASVAAMFSDRRLKTDIIKIGKYLGYNVYKWTYLWGEKAVGVMSDEINQDAVFKHPSGYDMVDYGRIA